ncbi:hypothetical protein [Pseudomonas sp. SWRI111]|uniref:hypothetical protein n=1 Tax=Pseudomonas sp. SWRI111 TaxID=2745507 RepID=UPI001EE17999|nr:hypothetical protein [Pseudomonas sp. SWRI111]
MSMRTFDEVLPDDAEINLYAPQLPDSNTSVAGADCGIAKAFYDLRPDGATVIIHPVLAQQPLDTFSIHVNGQMRVDSQQAQSTNDTVTLHIPKNLLRSEPGFVNELTYTVKRTTGAEENYELPLTILYNAIRPGMEDQNGDEGHSELELVLPGDVLQDGIDADRAALGVQVYFSYPYCRAYDRIQLSCNGHDVYREVHPDEAPAAPTSVPTRIGLLLQKTDLEAAGDHLQFSFSYTVNDQIGNGADLNSPWSAPVRVVVDLKGARMAAPDIAEDPDDPYDAPDTIDLNKLGSNDLTVQVHVLDSLWAINDTVRVTYRATPGTGAVVEHVVEELVGRLPFVHKLLIPNAKVIADSAVAVTCQQVRGGGVIATSKIARARVVVKPVITSLKNSFGVELEDGGTVSDNKVMLSGSALAGVVLQIFEGTDFIGEVTTGADYKWQSAWIPISVGQRRFTVKEKSGSQLESEPWLIERLALGIDKQPMILNGLSVKVSGWQKTGEDSLGNTALRTATGGVPPYTYLSSEPLTASVTEKGGKVTGLRHGAPTIYVIDQEGNEVNYRVSVSNVYQLQINDQLVNSPEAVSWMESMQGVPVWYASYRDMYRVYVPPPRTTAIWTCYPSVVVVPNGGFWWFGETLRYNAWCITPI